MLVRNKYQTLREWFDNNGLFWDNAHSNDGKLKLTAINQHHGAELYRLMKGNDTDNNIMSPNTIWSTEADVYKYNTNDPWNYLLNAPLKKIVYYTQFYDCVDEYKVIQPALEDRLQHLNNTGRLKNYFIIATLQVISDDFKDRYKDIATFYNLKKESLSIWGTTLLDPVAEFDQIKNAKDIKKHFLSLNNRAAWERQALFYFMNNYQLLDKSFFSYLCQSYNRKEFVVDFDNIDKLVGDDVWFSDNIDRQQLKTMIPYTINNSIKSDHSYGDPKFYTESFCSIVIETYSHRPYDFIFTEKTLKPILFEHPFIIFSNQGCLQQLKEFGFETFSDVFDESYDKIESSQLRLEAIFKEILRISSWSIEDCAKIYKKLEPRIKYNKELLIDKYFKNSYNINKGWSDAAVRVLNGQVPLLTDY